MQFNRTHTVIMILVGLAVILAFAVVFIPNEKVTGGSAARSSLTVVPADGTSLGQSLTTNDLLPAPASEDLQNSQTTVGLQPTGQIR